MTITAQPAAARRRRSPFRARFSGAGRGAATLGPGEGRPASELVLSADGLDFIKTHEGFKPKVYNDIAGLPTIGYGHKIRPGETFSAGIGEGAAKSLLATDAQKAVSAVQTHVKRPLTQNQFNALVSFAYNAGVGAFESSTLLKKINAGDDEGAAAEFGRWNKVHQNGKLVASKGLTDRRAAERALFER